MKFVKKQTSREEKTNDMIIGARAVRVGRPGVCSHQHRLVTAPGTLGSMAFHGHIVFRAQHAVILRP